jgi:predicted HTH domain antitoxin
MGRLQFEGFLKERGVTEHAYSVEDLQQDMENLRKLDAKLSQQR